MRTNAVQGVIRGQLVAVCWILLLWAPFAAAYSQVGVEVESDGELSLEELAGFGMLDGDAVMAEVQRLAGAERTDAVQALIDGTSALSVSHQPDGLELQTHVMKFESSMRGEYFLDMDDTPPNARRRKAFFIAACRTLATRARERFAHEEDEEVGGGDHV